jgi:hypothetical protein
MCRKRDTATEHEEQRAYEGRTVRLDPALGEAALGERRACFGGRFPWWTLWLIWPLLALASKAAGALAALVPLLWTPLTVQITPLPLLLIGVGLALLLWRGRAR